MDSYTKFILVDQEISSQILAGWNNEIQRLTGMLKRESSAALPE
jgi:hypothetical protein